MDESPKVPRDYAPIWLSGLAATALLASLVSIGFRPEQRQPRASKASMSDATDVIWPTRAFKQAKHLEQAPLLVDPGPATPGPSLIDFQLTQVLDLEADIAWLLSRSKPAVTPMPASRELVLREPVAPLPATATQFADRLSLNRLTQQRPSAAADDLLVLTPREPLWSANPSRRAAHSRYAQRPLRVLRTAGRYWGRLQSRASQLPGWNLYASAFTTTPSSRSAGPILVGPSDRLAMAPARVAQQTSSRPVAQRSGASPIVSGINPVALLDLIKALVDEEEVADWASDAEAAVREAMAPQPADASIQSTLDDVSQAGMELADKVADASLAARLRRACYAIDRRSTAWQLATDMNCASAPLWSIGERGESKQAGNLWRQYLVANLPKLRSEGGQSVPGRRVTLDQLRFAASGPVVGLGPALRQECCTPTEPADLLAMVEAYEVLRSPRLAQRIARDTQQLGASQSDLQLRLAAEIEQKYRNANLRVAVADQMLERFLPAPPVSVQPVRDQIAGALVRGRAVTQTSLSLRLLPDPFLWRMGLEARGEVKSHTYANPGPVVLKSRATTQFLGRKLITVSHHGLQAAPAVCDATSRTRLAGLSTYYDSVPLLGSVIRSRARDEHAARRGIARRQSEQKVRVRVRNSLDEQAGPLLTKLEQRYSATVLDRATELGLAVTPVELRTTESRLIARVRVANDQQLAAHTPRNRAPSDSVASLQLHESLVNNVVDGLGIAGRRFTPAELQSYVQRRLQLPPHMAADSLKPPNEPVELVFDDAEPVRLILADGRAELVLAFRELTFGKKRFEQFKVHAFYLPVTDGIEAHLVRDGGLQIEGRMRTASRIRLHGVFTQVLNIDRPVPLLKLPPAGEPRLDGLMVTQLVLTDGWLGLAIGPDTAGPASGVAGAGALRTATVGRYLR